jgi:hypothetical protein
MHKPGRLYWTAQPLRSSGTIRNTSHTLMDILDILLIALIVWIALDLLNDGGWGGGKRGRVPMLCPVSSS